MTPELQIFYDRERSAELRRRDMHFAEIEKNRGNLHGWSGPGPFTPRTPAQMLEAAAEKLEAHTAFKATPEGKFAEGVADIDKTLVDLMGFLEQARSARSRSWVGGLAHCDAAMSKVQMCARKITEIAIDCQVEIGIAASELERT